MVGVLAAGAVLAGAAGGFGLAFGEALETTVVAASSDEALDVTGYDIAVGYRPEARELRGVATVSAAATGALDSFTLQLDGPDVRSVTVGGKAAKFSREDEKNLVIAPAQRIGRGARFQVRIEYGGTPGAGWLPTTSGGATAFMGSSSAWFPVREGVHDGARFSLAATVPKGWSAVSIGRQGAVRRGPEESTFRWTEPNVDPEAIAVSIDRFAVERSVLPDGTPVVNAYGPGLKKSTKPLADRLPEVLRFLSGRFGRYPFGAAGNVFVHVNDDGPGTAPQTRPVYLGAGNARFMNLETVVHEQAHQWYGVSAAPRRVEDACLSECFAVYATWLWDEAKEGADLDARYREQVEAAKGDADFWSPLHAPGRSPGIAMYEKGPLAVHALRRQVGEDAFDRLLELWPRRHRGRHVDVRRFEAFAERVAGRDLGGFFQAWFREGTVPPDEYLWPGALAR